MIDPTYVHHVYGDRIFTSTLYYGQDVRKSLRDLPDNSVHCVVTSPPYFGLRRYLPEGSVVLRDDITDDERMYVENELKKAGLL